MLRKHVGAGAFDCPGRDDVVAPPELWAELCKAWRVRTKTTVVTHGQWTQWHLRRAYTGVGSRGVGSAVDLTECLPDGLEDRRGTWTIVVSFEPEDR